MDPVTLGILGLGAYLLMKPKSSESHFRYQKRDGSWRAYFKGDPPSKSHLYHDQEGYFVCWDRPLNSQQEAKQVARHWMKTYGQK